MLRAFAAAGAAPRTRADPHPDLGTQAVREGLGVVVYVRSAYPPQAPGTVLVPVEPPVHLPFHVAWRPASRTPALSAVLGVARALPAVSPSPLRA